MPRETAARIYDAHHSYINDVPEINLVHYGLQYRGNLVGAIQPSIELADEPDTRAFYFMADYHALTTIDDPDRLEYLTYDIAATWLAFGLDPDEVLFYRQSDIPEIFELTWVLSCHTAKGKMNRAHAYKAARRANEEAGDDPDAGIDMGLYSYPVLMAADILMFNADEVPVGEDQRQHVEWARDIARTFNHTYDTDLFELPEERIDTGTSAKIPGLDGQKMSASYDNTIPVFCDVDELEDRVFKIETDSSPREAPKDPGTSTIFQIYRQFGDEEQVEDLREQYREGIGWGTAKQELFDLLVDVLEEPRDRYESLMDDPAQIDAILEEGAERAREIAVPFMSEIRQTIGIDR
ncbi:MAG: tryptophan--tRNA ligase [Bradymonadaceae bacterium]